MQELKRCPFCGGESVLLNSSREIPEESVVFWVYCKNCSATSMTYDKREEAIECWNTRTPGWIPVEERRPEEEYCTVLCVTDKNYYCVAVYNEKYGFRTGDINVEGAIIAWRPLPDPYRPEPLETRKELEEDSKGERENETFTSRNIEAV